MKTFSLIGMICTMLLLTIHTTELNAWTWWEAKNLNINADRAIYINDGCSADEQTRISNSCKAWFWTGAKFRPYIVSTTSRAAGKEDKVNVIGNDKGTNTWLGLTNFWNNSVDECDIRINTGKYSWHVGTHWTMPTTPTQYSYQSVGTHEMGHLMGLGHSSENSGETDATLRNATMYYSTGSNTSRFATLGRDDICGIQNRVGFRTGEWQIAYNPGYDVRILKNDNEAQIYIDPKGQGSTWGESVIVRKECIGGWIDAQTRNEWQEYDMDHAMIVALGIVGVDGVTRTLCYARNAPNWYSNSALVGWPNLNESPAFAVSYNQWVCVVRSLWDDYRTEYNINPAYVIEFQVRHFVYLGWQGDHGCKIKENYIRGTEPY
jgi:hypothetical protein